MANLTKKGIPKKKPGPKPSAVTYDHPIQFFFDKNTKNSYKNLDMSRRRELIIKVRTVVIDFVNEK
jgi:hypothetical protein